MRVFLDANVLFSAADAASATRALLDVLRRHAEVVTSPHAVAEARRNILVKRPRDATAFDRLAVLVRATHAFAEHVPVTLPEEDIPILAGAIGSRSTHLWTGDKRHFGRLYGRAVSGVTIVDALMMLRTVAEHGWWKEPK